MLPVTRPVKSGVSQSRNGVTAAWITKAAMSCEAAAPIAGSPLGERNLRTYTKPQA